MQVVFILKIEDNPYLQLQLLSLKSSILGHYKVNKLNHSKSWALGLSILQEAHLGKPIIQRKKLPFTLCCTVLRLWVIVMLPFLRENLVWTLVNEYVFSLVFILWKGISEASYNHPPETTIAMEMLPELTCLCMCFLVFLFYHKPLEGENCAQNPAQGLL